MIDILVVDDSRLARKRTLETISKLDIKHSIVAEAEDGIEALDKFNKLRPHLVITDIEMPNMDGMRLVEEIRKVDKEVNIIVISSMASEQVKQQTLKSAHSDFVKKPIDAKILELLLLKLENKLFSKKQ